METSTLSVISVRLRRGLWIAVDTMASKNGYSYVANV